MEYLITKQRNFGHIKYNWPGGSGKTVKSSGCGPCAMLMVIENMLGKPWLMADWIKWVLSTGARVNGGTDMYKLCQAVVKKYGLEFTTTSSEATLKEHIKKGGMAIANVGGKRSGWAGLFSDSGHFVTVLGLLQDGRFIIGDPGIYSGKFNSSFRRSKVQVDGDLVYVNAANLHQDTLNRTPNYYLLKQAAAVTKPIEPIEEEEKMYKTIDDVPKDLYPAVQRRIDCGALKGDGKGNINVTESMARVWAVEDRMNPFYANLEDVPEYWREDTAQLMRLGKIKGDGKNEVGKYRQELSAIIAATR